MGEPGFWDDNEAAQRTVGELKGLKTIVAPMKELTRSADDLEVLFEMAEEDPSVTSELAPELERLEAILDDLELKALFERTE